MFRLICHKIFYAALTLFGVLTVIFFLFNVLPGDPARMMLGQNEDSAQLQIIKRSTVLINHSLHNTYITSMM